MRAVAGSLDRLDCLTVAVTGAGGLLGGRLVSVLLSTTRARVVALVRSPGRTGQLPVGHARLRVAVADLDAPEPSPRDLPAVDVMVHCAFGNQGPVGQRWHTTVAGTSAALGLAQSLGVRRFIHVSSMSVYDLESAEVVSERSPAFRPEDGDMEYAAQKLHAEAIVTAAGDRLETVVVQPTIIYGPNSLLWTITPLARLAEPTDGLPSGDDGGVCNAVFVDDVVHALMLATVAPAVAAERFLVSGPEPVSWGAFFDAYRAMAMVPVPTGEAGHTLAHWERRVYSSRTVVSTDHARRTLGYSASFDLASGMAVTRDWARQAGLLR